MRPLVVGAGGQLGQALSALFRARGFELAAYAHGELEIADADAVRRAIERHHASHVFNAAAYNAVDRAEVEARQAFAVNALGPMNLALAACEQGAILMHYSTDYVFDGAKQEAYVEDDPPSPLSVYARSKLLGEQAVIAVSPAAYVVRTAWVFAPGGNNFISRLLAAADSGRRLAYVDDVCSSPTYAEDLAQASIDRKSVV